ncbi:hypothetical protein YYE_04985, partial [Plasmodium vinckei vinckei]
CNLLLEGDSYFNGKDANTTKINKRSTIKAYCRNGSCKTNEDYINALIAYIIKKFKDTISRKTTYNDYDEYLLMWISDKLFNMYHESKGTNKKIGFVYLITLNQAYVKHLKIHKQRLDYWDILNMQPGLKEVNLKYMSEFYKLLNHICKTIVDYETNGAGSKNLSKNSIDCRRQYRTLYRNIPKCQSYLNLLNKLKGIYDTFRSSAIKRTDLKNKLIKLTLENGNEVETVHGFKSYDFNNEECKFQKKKRTPSKPSNPNPGPAPPIAPSLSISQKQDSPSPPLPTEQTKDNQEKTPDGQQENSGSKQGDSLGGPGSGQVTTGNGTESTDDGEGDKGSQGGSDTGPGASGSQSASWLSFDIGSSFFEIVSKGMEQLNNALDFVEEKKEQLTKVTDTIKDFYSTSVSNIKTAYDNSRNFLNTIIVHISSQPEKVDISDNSDNNKLGSGGTGDGLPTPNGSPPSQKDSPQTPSGTPYSSLPSENPGTETKGNGITKIGDIYVLKEYKQIGISIIVLLIPK